MSNVSVNFNMVTTALELPGYKVVKSFGLVRGITVRSRSIFGTIGASLETLVDSPVYSGGFLNSGTCNPAA